MIISKKHGFIFIAVGKTGTSSIERTLGHLNEVDVPKHAHLSELHKYSDIDTNEYFKFCFTRNPWERAVSQYKQWKKPNDLDNEERLYLYNLSNKYNFSDFVKMVSRAKAEFWSGRTTISYITDRDGKVDIDFVGFFENLQTDFDRVCKKLGLENQKLPRANMARADVFRKMIGKGKNYANLYDDEARNIISTAYKSDIDYFNYKF